VAVKLVTIINSLRRPAVTEQLTKRVQLHVHHTRRNTALKRIHHTTILSYFSAVSTGRITGLARPTVCPLPFGRPT